LKTSAKRVNHGKFSRRIFERPEGFAETDSDREVYLNALGSGNPVEKETDRYDYNKWPLKNPKTH